MSDEPRRTERDHVTEESPSQGRHVRSHRDLRGNLATELNYLAMQDRAAEVAYMRLVLAELEAGRVDDAIASIRTWIETTVEIDRRSP